MKKLLVVIGSILCLGTVMAGPHGCPPPPPHHHYHHYDHWRSYDYVNLGLGVASILSNHMIVNRQLDLQQQQLQMIAQQQNQSKTVYWCECEKGFYPQVRACPCGWTALPAN